jgi:hypothetical protein
MPNAFQEQNLKTLSAHLRKVADRKFDMAYYLSNWDNSSASRCYCTATDKIGQEDAPKYNECGTAACAAGYGPAAGITPLPKETWGDYVDRVFSDDLDARYWMFDEDWKDLDNTPEGAAERIDYYLKHGAPWAYNVEPAFDDDEKVEDARREDGSIDYEILFNPSSVK